MVLSTTYFGSVDWYAQIARANQPVFINAYENFVKQTERTRCRIATANGVQTLSIPVTKPALPTENGKPLTSEMLISDHANWRKQHWNALCSAYGESPFFDYYADDIKPFFEPDWTNLFDFNMDIMKKMCELLDLDVEIGTLTEREVSPVTPQNPSVNAEIPSSCIREYYQTFARRHGFIPGLSILDLLFNEGNESILYLLGQL